MLVIPNFSNSFRFLSNFYDLDTPIFSCRTAEHYYQYKKAKYLKDKLKIIRAETPGKAKRIAKQLVKKGKMVDNWELNSLRIMRKAVRLKFTLNNELGDRLLNTKKFWLIEGNYWHDNFYGDCTCDKCKNIEI